MNWFKKKPKKSMEYEFEADAGQFTCVFKEKVDSTRMFDFYNSFFRRKLAKVLNPEQMFEKTNKWELGTKEKGLVGKKLRGKLLFPAIEQVKTDLPAFKAYNETLDAISFEKQGEAYEITIKFSGLCEGEDKEVKGPLRISS